MAKGKEKGFQMAAHGFFICILICILIPFMILFSSSITQEEALVRQGYGILPTKVDFTAYKLLLVDSTSILRGYGISVIVTVTGTVVNLLLTVLYAYPLSRKDLPGREFFSFFLFFTMLCHGGIVSSYIMWTQTFHIKNTLWALIVPNLLMQGFYVIMARTYFTANIPTALIDASRIDGAGEVKILAQIVLPMSLPILTALGLMVGLSYWNDWLNGIYYVNEDKYYSIQVLLNRMLLNTETMKKAAKSGLAGGRVPSVSMKMAVAVLGALPVLVIYPFLQKYFVKGITVGAVKG